MRYHEFPAPARLQRLVECFWWTKPGKALPEYPVAPDGCVDIVYSPSLAGELQLVGAMTQARRFALPANQLQFGVRFRPGMSTACLPLPGLETTDQSIAMGEIWGRKSRRLTERIAEAQSELECIQVVEESLPTPGDITVVQRLCASIVEQGGQVGMDDLAFQAGLSVRQLRRVFLDQVGLSPKHFCRIIRFRKSLSLLAGAGRGDWAQVALECGFYDQAHFINEFREFTGSPPGEFVTLER